MKNINSQHNKDNGLLTKIIKK